MSDDDMEEVTAPNFRRRCPALQLHSTPREASEGIRSATRYRSPVELGWGKNIIFDHDFIGRKALEPEVADPMSTPQCSAPSGIHDYGYG